MKGRNQLLYTIVGFFVIFGLVISMNSKSVVAEEDKVFYLPDLKVGDFIPNGSILIIGENYKNSRGHIKETVKVKISHDSYYQEIDIPVGEVYTMKSFKDYFSETTEEYDGWVIINFPHYNTFEVIIEPVNLDDITSEKDVVFNENNIEVKITCKNNVEPTYNWYKVKKIDDLQINTPNQSLWNQENGVYSYILNNYKTSDDLTSSITLKLNAEKDDILSFDYRQVESRLYYSLNGVSATEEKNNGNSYNNLKINLTNSGYNEIIFYDLMRKKTIDTDNLYLHNNDYFYLRNISILTPLNEGSLLDLSKVSNGDEIYYECECGMFGYKYSNSFRYGDDEPVVEGESSNDILDKNSSVKNDSKNKTTNNNPPTYSTVIYVLSIIFVIGFSIFINREKIFRKDS